MMAPLCSANKEYGPQLASCRNLLSSAHTSTSPFRSLRPEPSSPPSPPSVKVPLVPVLGLPVIRALVPKPAHLPHYKPWALQWVRVRGLASTLPALLHEPQLALLTGSVCDS